MSEYAGITQSAAALIAQKGFVATIRGEPTPTDPVTGGGGSDGAIRSVAAVKVGIDRSQFSETLTERAQCTLICDGPVQVGEVWVDGSAERPVIGTMIVEPDNASHIITKALIGA